MKADQIKWNQRYGSENSLLGEAPSPFLIREIERIKRLAQAMLRSTLHVAKAGTAFFWQKTASGLLAWTYPT